MRSLRSDPATQRSYLRLIALAVVLIVAGCSISRYSSPHSYYGPCFDCHTWGFLNKYAVKGDEK
jgi:hypothetical protein